MTKYRVGELLLSIQQMLAEKISGNIMVNGEVTEFTRASSGHIYFSLKDPNGKIKAVLFRNSILSNKFIPNNGDTVDVIGELKIYPPEGYCQIIVKKIIYNKEGDFWKKFEELKNKLQIEGLFSDSTKKPIAKYPKRVALLTSFSGAAVKDFLTTSDNNGSNFHVDIWNIPVQGSTASKEIVRVIEKVSNKSSEYDVLVLTRGGGSLEDLSVFNDEYIVRALKAAPIPTISAIGHEQDFTLVDFVSDLRASTPTAAAVILNEPFKKASNILSNLIDRLNKQIVTIFENAEILLDRLLMKLDIISPVHKVSNYHNRIDLYYSLVVRGSYMYISRKKAYIIDLAHKIDANNPCHRVASMLRYVHNITPHLQNSCLKVIYDGFSNINFYENKLLSLNMPELLSKLHLDVDFLVLKLNNLVHSKLLEREHNLNILIQRLSSLNPDNIIKKGYALVTKKDGSIVTGIKDVNRMEELEIKLKDGYISAVTIDILN